MAVEIVQLEGKHPTEELSYTFPVTHIPEFADGTDTVAAPGATWYAYDATALGSNIAATIVKAASYTDTSVSVKIHNDTSGHSYIVAGRFTSALGGIYVVAGRFSSNNRGVALT
jgi:hypothetical protein